MTLLNDHEAPCAFGDTTTAAETTDCNTLGKDAAASARLKAASRLVEHAAHGLAGEIDKPIVANLILTACTLKETSSRVERLTFSEFEGQA